MNYFDRDGRPLDPETAGVLMSDPAYCRVALTGITSTSDPTVDIIVSTVWLGFDPLMAEDGTRVFQTAVFGAEAKEKKDASSEMEARGLHLEAVTIIAALTEDSRVDELPDWPADWKADRRV